MGIDPVTHSPRLDLLDISSILSSSFYNQSNANMFGVNPELLRLAASLLSSQRDQNPSFLHHNDQKNQFGETLIQENHHLQLQSHDQTLIQEIPSCVPFSSDQSTHLMEPNVDQLPSSFSHFNPQNCQLNEWQNNGMVLPSSNLDNFMAMENYGFQGSVQSVNVVDPASNLTPNDFDFTSHLSNLSTPSSSPTPLNSNSNSTYINGSSCTEDEREISYCSNLFKYEYQDILDSNVFM